MSFPEKLQKLRKDQGLSQEKLAEIIGVSRQAISKWESGQTYPEMDKLIVLSNMFEVSIDDLVKDKGMSSKIENSTNSEDDEDEDWEINIIIGLFIIGLAFGFIFNNFLLGTFAAFIGLGITYIIKGVLRGKGTKFNK